MADFGFWYPVWSCMGRKWGLVPFPHVVLWCWGSQVAKGGCFDPQQIQHDSSLPVICLFGWVTYFETQMIGMVINPQGSWFDDSSPRPHCFVLNWVLFGVRKCKNGPKRQSKRWEKAGKTLEWSWKAKPDFSKFPTLEFGRKSSNKTCQMRITLQLAATWDMAQSMQHEISLWLGCHVTWQCKSPTASFTLPAPLPSGRADWFVPGGGVRHSACLCCQVRSPNHLGGWRSMIGLTVKLPCACSIEMRETRKTDGIRCGLCLRSSLCQVQLVLLNSSCWWQSSENCLSDSFLFLNLIKVPFNTLVVKNRDCYIVKYSKVIQATLTDYNKPSWLLF